MFRSATTKIAHSSTFSGLGGDKDLRLLQDMINAEKAVLQSLQRLSHDFGRASDALRAWGGGEGEDLADVLSGSHALLSHFSTALTELAAHEESVRTHMKAVRSREEALDEMRRRRRALGAKADSAERKLAKMSPEHKNLAQQTDLLQQLQDQIRQLDSEIMTEEAKLGDFKRAETKNWMGVRFGGLQELCEKGALIGDYGKKVIQSIPLEHSQPGLPRAIYGGKQHVQSLVTDANRSIMHVLFSATPSAQRPSHDLPPPPPPDRYGSPSQPDRRLSLLPEIMQADDPHPLHTQPPQLQPIETPSLNFGHLLDSSEAPASPAGTGTNRAGLLGTGELSSTGASPALTPASSHFRMGANDSSLPSSEFPSPMSMPYPSPYAPPQNDDMADFTPAVPDKGTGSLGARFGMSPPRGAAPMGRFATAPLRGGRPRTDSAATAGSGTGFGPIAASAAQSRDGWMPEDRGHPPLPVHPESNLSHTSAMAEQGSHAPGDDNRSLTPPPPRSQDRPPSLDLGTPEADSFSGSVAAALAHGWSPNADTSTAQGAAPTPTQHAGAPIEGQTTGTGFAPPAGPPPAPVRYAPPPGPPPAYMDSAPEAAAPSSPTGSLRAHVRDAPNISMPPDSPTRGIPMPHTMPVLHERPTAESLQAIEPPPGARPILQEDDEGETQLSYITGPSPVPSPVPSPNPAAAAVFEHGHQRTESSSTAEAPGVAKDRHVKFGGVVDVDEELEKRDKERKSMEESRPSEPPPRPGHVLPRVPVPPLVMPPTSEDLDEERLPSPVAPANLGQNLATEQPSHADRSVTPDMDENTLNAAAAREVSREMDSLAFQALPAPTTRTPSPLLPPQPLFAVGRQISPRPSLSGLTSPPTQQSALPSVPATRNGSQPESPVSSTRTPPISPTSPKRTPVPPPAINLPRPNLSPTGSLGTPFQTPPEYPAPVKPLSPAPSWIKPPAAGSPVGGSLPGSPVLSGAGGKISAAAFRRVQNRMPSADSRPGGTLADTSPLSISKRGAPGPSMRSVSQPPSGTSPTGFDVPPPPPPPSMPTNALAGGVAPLAVPEAVPRPGGADAGPRPKSTASATGSDFEFDYIAAYENDDAPASPGGRPGAGDGIGKNAVKLEEDAGLR